MISVVLASYNGEKYITEQLDSIRKQILPVDEVLIYDDQSTDRTVALCEQFIQQFQLENWSVIVNEVNLGYYGNFMTGVKDARGDIIFLCDQDDIWCQEKTKVMVDTMIKNEDILSLTSTFSTFTNDGKILSEHIVHPNAKRGGLTQINLKQFMKFYCYLGMTMAIRKELYDLVSTDNPNGTTHDIILNMYACIDGGLYHLDDVLTRRRVYETSVSMSSMKSERLNKYGGNPQLQLVCRGKKYSETAQYGIYRPEINDLLEKYHINFLYRENYMRNKSYFKWIVNIIHFPYYESFKSFIKDGYCMMKY